MNAFVASMIGLGPHDLTGWAWVYDADHRLLGGRRRRRRLHRHQADSRQKQK